MLLNSLLKKSLRVQTESRRIMCFPQEGSEHPLVLVSWREFGCRKWSLKVTSCCVPCSFPAPCGGGCWRRGARGFAPHTASALTPAPTRSRDSSAGTPAAPPELPEHCKHRHTRTQITKWQERVIMQVFSVRIIWVYTNKTSVITLMFPIKTIRRRWNWGSDQICLVCQQTRTISQHTTTHSRHYGLNKNTTVMSLIEKQQEGLQMIKLRNNERVSVLFPALIKQPRSSRKTISLVIFFSLSSLTSKIQKTFVKTITNNHKWRVFFLPNLLSNTL